MPIWRARRSCPTRSSRPRSRCADSLHSVGQVQRYLQCCNGCRAAWAAAADAAALPDEGPLRPARTAVDPCHRPGFAGRIVGRTRLGETGRTPQHYRFRAARVTAMTRRAKIVCTMGPATSSEEGIAALLDAGMNVARLNFSHGDYADHEAIYHRLREAARSADKALAILADLQGPKIRLGRFEDGPHDWPTGEQVTITVEDIVGSRNRVSTTYHGLARDARPGVPGQPVVGGGHPVAAADDVLDRDSDLLPGRPVVRPVLEPAEPDLRPLQVGQDGQRLVRGPRGLPQPVVDRLMVGVVAVREVQPRDVHA